MPNNNKKKLKPIPYRDMGRTETLHQPKGEFVDLFKVMQERIAVRRAAAEVTRSHNKPKHPSNRHVDRATHLPTEKNPMPKDNKKKFKPIPYRYVGSVETLPQPKGKFVNPFKAMRDRQAAEREAESARSRQQGQTSE